MNTDTNATPETFQISEAERKSDNHTRTASFKTESLTSDQSRK